MLDEMWVAPWQPLGQQGAGSEQSWPKDGKITFGEVLHALNPLQHLPVIGTIYRAITGDTIPAPMRLLGSLIGGLLTGGPLGLATGVIGCFVEEAFHRARETHAEPEAAAVTPAMAASAYAKADQLYAWNGVGTA